ncbi:MAG: fibrobacter succinogenes major paralogous domain-containing protein [Chitinispirillales bacterium]|jgi:uncharacterized protein (TIGR02145 family)|nr:fibrobacter succinogenes major paralogous domain-containing protein [Chitinispirillales bacterium]
MNIKKALFLVAAAFAFAAMAADGSGKANSFTDSRDGRKYITVQIGKQAWMAENLNYKSGNSWCYEDDESNCKNYGRLYDWGTAVKACPSGWHLPDTAEWNRLAIAVGGVRKVDKEGNVNFDGAGKKLKSKTGWKDDERGNGTDEFGFSAMPGGIRRSFDGVFVNAGLYGKWWSATEGGGNAYNRGMDYDYGSIREYSNNKEYGYSVRCVQD